MALTRAEWLDIVRTLMASDRSLLPADAAKLADAIGDEVAKRKL